MTFSLPKLQQLLEIPDPDQKPVSHQRDREILLAKPTHQVERLAPRLLVGQRQSVRCHPPLDRLPHLRGRSEEAVRGHQPLDALVRATEVVGLDVQIHPPLAVPKVRKYRPRQELLPQRLPETLDLALRLRMVRTALDVTDALAPQLLLEFRLATPRGVLPALVRQDLTRRSVVRDAARERFQHQARALVMRQHQGHDVPGVVVQKSSHVKTLVPSQQKREDVRLPQLVRLGAFEPVLHELRLLPHRRLLHEPFLMQDPPHRGL
jgi:hypothetical protein